MWAKCTVYAWFEKSGYYADKEIYATCTECMPDTNQSIFLDLGGQ